MSEQKKYSAREAAVAVLNKAQEMLKNSKALQKYESENSSKLGVHAPNRHQDAIDEKDIVGKRRVREQKDPRTNPKEIAEGNNAAPGAIPQNTEKYSAEMKKNEEKSSKNKFGEHVRQHIVDKVHNSMHERGVPTENASPNYIHECARNMGIKDMKSHEIVHASDTYRHDEALHKAEKIKKDATDAIQHGINVLTGGSSAQGATPPTPPQPNPSVASALAGAFGKSEAQALDAKNTGNVKLAKFMEYKANKRLKK